MEIANEKPNYFSILTAEVRYNKNISANEKLLFSEITALCNKNGECWASNNYFAKLYGVEKRTISRWINNLAEEGLINAEVVKNSNNRVIKRIITPNLTMTKMSIPMDKNVHRGIDKIVHRGIDKNVYENNINMNNINNNNINNNKNNIIPYINIKNKSYMNYEQRQNIDFESLYANMKKGN